MTLSSSLGLSMNRRPHLLEKEARKRKKEMGSSSSSGGGGKRTLAQDLIAVEESPGGLESTKNVVVVMDGLKEFTMDPLMWVLENIAHEAHCTITLLGVMPWLNIPLFSKTWSDIWTMDLEDLSAIKKKTKWKSDAKYQKIEQLINLCQQYGVKPQMRSEMGYPLQLLVVEQIISLHATLVVFDRHHQKYREYYAEKIPCSMVMMNEEGEVDMIKGKSHVENLENISEESPISSAPTTKLMIAERLRKIFLAKSSRKSCLKIRSTRSA
ncbi:unnamed protein product [Camellia sinensis]